jgi:beta-glucosidase
VSAFIGHATGRHAPGVQDPRAPEGGASPLLGHGLAIEAMRGVDPDAQYGVTLSLSRRIRRRTIPPTWTRRAAPTA